jgi:integrase
VEATPAVLAPARNSIEEDARISTQTDPAAASVFLLDAGRSYLAASKSDATRRAYSSDMATYVAWCRARGLHAVPGIPEAIAAYLAELAQLGRKASTITRAAAAIGEAHAAAGCASPRESAVVRAMLKGIRRRLGTAPRQKAPLLAGDLRDLVRRYLAGGGLAAARDRALLLVGFAGGFRRGELVALDLDDVRFVDDGLEVFVRRSKTDQEGVGSKIGIPFGSAPDVCPVRALRAWLRELDHVDVDAGDQPRPIFREVTRHGRVGRARLGAQAVARVVKRLAAAGGLDPDTFGGHSLRAGFITSAARAGKLERDIMRQSRHRSVVTVRGYIREGELFKDNAAEGLL